ncbi:MAG TPA: hypothetical protein VNH11_19695 [Pirellulales bacterium]|nr:hypothetical protein [Pirellulales bacterium]
MTDERNKPVAWPYEAPSAWAGEGWLDIFEVGPYFWGGVGLPRFWREANRIWIDGIDGHRRLVGVLVETIDDFEGLDGLLTDATGVTLWFSSTSFRHAAGIRHADAVETVVVLDARDLVNLSPIRVFTRLQAAYLQDARITDLGDLLDLRDLRALFLDGLECLRSFKAVARIASLRHIGMRTGEYPDLRPIGELGDLISLTLHEDTSDDEFGAIANGCRRLQQLVCYRAVKLRTLAPLRDLARLETLEVSGTHVEDFRALESLTELRSVDLFNNDKLRTLTPFLSMPRLCRFELAACTGLTDFAALQHMPRLRSLSLPDTVAEEGLRGITSACPNLERLEFGTPIGFNKADEPEIDAASVEDLKHLRVLRIWRPLRNADALGGLQSLEVLHIILARRCRDVSFLSSLKLLNELFLHLDGEVNGTDAIGKLHQLQSLTMAFGPFDALALAPLQRLIFLRIRGGTGLANVEVLGELANVVIVSIEDSTFERLWKVSAMSALASLTVTKGQLRDIGGLVDAQRLRYLNLEGNKHSLDLSPLARLTDLRKLDISAFESPYDLAPLRASPRLAELRATYCNWLTSADLVRLAGAPKLTSLSLDACDKLDDVAPLAKLATLESLSLNWCSEISNIRPIEKLGELRSLGLSGCDGIRDFRPIGRLKRLVNLTLDMTELRDVSFVRALPDLRYIDVSQCWELGDISPLVGLRAKGCVVHIAHRQQELDELDARAGATTRKS